MIVYILDISILTEVIFTDITIVVLLNLFILIHYKKIKKFVIVLLFITIYTNRVFKGGFLLKTN